MYGMAGAMRGLAAISHADDEVDAQDPEQGYGAGEYPDEEDTHYDQDALQEEIYKLFEPFYDEGLRSLALKEAHMINVYIKSQGKGHFSRIYADATSTGIIKDLLKAIESEKLMTDVPPQEHLKGGRSAIVHVYKHPDDGSLTMKVIESEVGDFAFEPSIRSVPLADSSKEEFVFASVDATHVAIFNKASSTKSEVHKLIRAFDGVAEPGICPTTKAIHVPLRTKENSDGDFISFTPGEGTALCATAGWGYNHALRTAIEAKVPMSDLSRIGSTPTYYEIPIQPFKADQRSSWDKLRKEIGGIGVSVCNLLSIVAEDDACFTQKQAQDAGNVVDSVVTATGKIIEVGQYLLRNAEIVEERPADGTKVLATPRGINKELISILTEMESFAVFAGARLRPTVVSNGSMQVSRPDGSLSHLVTDRRYGFQLNSEAIADPDRRATAESLNRRAASLLRTKEYYVPFKIAFFYANLKEDDPLPWKEKYATGDYEKNPERNTILEQAAVQVVRETIVPAEANETPEQKKAVQEHTERLESAFVLEEECSLKLTPDRQKVVTEVREAVDQDTGGAALTYFRELLPDPKTGLEGPNAIKGERMVWDSNESCVRTLVPTKESMEQPTYPVMGAILVPGKERAIGYTWLSKQIYGEDCLLRIYQMPLEDAKALLGGDFSGPPRAANPIRKVTVTSVHFQEVAVKFFCRDVPKTFGGKFCVPPVSTLTGFTARLFTYESAIRNKGEFAMDEIAAFFRPGEREETLARFALVTKDGLGRPLYPREEVPIEVVNQVIGELFKAFAVDGVPTEGLTAAWTKCAAAAKGIKLISPHKFMSVVTGGDRIMAAGGMARRFGMTASEGRKVVGIYTPDDRQAGSVPADPGGDTRPVFLQRSSKSVLKP